MTTPGLASGTRVGPYEIVALLGTGGMGEVYRAKDLRLSREVAIKVLHGEIASDADRVRRFEQEARAAGVLNHPNIVAVYDTGLNDGAPYIVSELLQGQTLRDRLAGGAPGTRKSVEYAVQIAHGLAAAHEKGIVHRDLKPENLFLTKDGLVKILDFGIAKLSRPGEESAGTNVETISHTNPGTIIGTVGYMSPEQVRGLPTDHRSDLFSFGTVLYEMLTGRRAFKGTTAADTLSAILREDPTEPSRVGPPLSTELLRVVRRCLEKSPEDRFQSARDLAFALEGATAETTISTRLPLASERGPRVRGALLGLALFAALGLAAWAIRNAAPTMPPTNFQRLTFRVGRPESAAFAPDGETILYSGAWGRNPVEVFSTRASARGERALGLTDAMIVAISSQEELAVLLRPEERTWDTYEGTLARAPMAGGTPREVLDGVVSADWSPDGKELAVVHVVGDRYLLEYPIGKVLLDVAPPGSITKVKISRNGEQLAIVEHPVANDMQGGVAVVDRAGHKRSLASGQFSLGGCGWSPDSKEIWFEAGRVNGVPQQVRAVSLDGKERLLLEVPGGFQLYSVSPRGQLLGAHVMSWAEIRARPRGAADEADLPSADLSFLSDLSDDGKEILGTDQGQGGGSNFRFYVQKTDGSPALWLGEGDGQALSPDGRSALALLVHRQPQQLMIVPTGAGEARTLDPGPVVQFTRAVWDPSGRRVVFSGADKQEVERVYVEDASGGAPKAVTADDVGLPRIGRPVSPDGRTVVALGPDSVPALYRLDGGEPVAIPGLGTLDVPIVWTTDGRALMVAHYDRVWPSIARVDVATGRSQPWTGLAHPNLNAFEAQARVLVTPDGQAYAYGYVRTLGDLYLTSPLR